MTEHVRPLRTADLPAVARLHRTALPVGFFPRLGERYLRTYHATFVDGPHAIGLAVELDGRLVGFVVGPSDADAHGAWTARERGLRLAVAMSWALLLRPSELWTFLTTRLGRYARGLVRRLRPATSRPGAGATTTGTSAGSAAPAVLVHVAVDPTARGHGFGVSLVDGFVAACASAGAAEVRLVTDADGDAVAFYEHLDWDVVARRPATDGRAIVEFRRATA